MTKLSKILRILAAAAFLTALAVNVKVTLTDPFVGMSEEAIATGTDIISSNYSDLSSDKTYRNYAQHTFSKVVQLKEIKYTAKAGASLEGVKKWMLSSLFDAECMIEITSAKTTITVTKYCDKCNNSSGSDCFESKLCQVTQEDIDLVKN